MSRQAVRSSPSKRAQPFGQAGNLRSAGGGAYWPGKAPAGGAAAGACDHAVAAESAAVTRTSAFRHASTSIPYFRGRARTAPVEMPPSTSRICPVT